MINFAAATIALASFATFEDAVKEFEACQASAAYGIITPHTEQFNTCQEIYTGIKLEFVDPALVAEYESLKRVVEAGDATSETYRRMHEISLMGYAGWTDWKEANADFHRPLVEETMAAAKKAVGL